MTFRTRKEAKAHIEEMMGWDAKAVGWTDLERPLKVERGLPLFFAPNCWAIQCNGNLMLYDDGYVR